MAWEIRSANSADLAKVLDNMHPAMGYEKDLLELIDDSRYESLSAANTYVAERHGYQMFIGGVFSVWHGRAICWGAFHRDMQPHYMLWVTRTVTRYLDEVQKEAGYRRLEMTVKSDYEKGQKWAKLLGFGREGLMHRYDPLGRDYYLYSRVRSS